MAPIPMTLTVGLGWHGNPVFGINNIPTWTHIHSSAKCESCLGYHVQCFWVGFFTWDRSWNRKSRSCSFFSSKVHTALWSRVYFVGGSAKTVQVVGEHVDMMLVVCVGSFWKHWCHVRRWHSRLLTRRHLNPPSSSSWGEMSVTGRT